jgi:ribosomal-protein-alanine N-acetyltransferase
MAFLRAGNSSEWAVVQGRGLWLRPPQIIDYGPWAELRTLSRAHLTPWEPSWPRDDLTKSAYRRRVKYYQREARDDLGYAYLMFESESDRLMGGLTLSNVRRGVTQSAMLGYWLGVPFVGRGHMTNAVKALLPHAFEVLRLHRVEAAVQPNNGRSVSVLEQCGFQREGLARRYLKINGQWQDHVIYAMLAEDWMSREERP